MRCNTHASTHTHTHTHKGNGEKKKDNKKNNNMQLAHWAKSISQSKCNKNEIQERKTKEQIEIQESIQN